MYTRNARLLNYAYFILQTVISLGYVLRMNYALIFNPVITTVPYLIVLTIEHYTPFRLNNVIRALLILTLTSHNLFGEYFNWYLETEFFDKTLHLIGTCTFTLVSFSLINYFLKINSSNPRVFTIIFAVLIGTTLGTIFELMEFFLDVISNEHNQHGLLDTNLDIIFNIIGSLLAGIVLVKHRTTV